MKLRNRKKRVLGNVKQEEQKADTALNSTSSFTVDELSSCDVHIKQEDTKNDNSSLKQNDGFGKEGYYYRCDICKQRMPNAISVLQHRKLIHNVKRTCPSMIKDINTGPDVHDPNFHCKPCKVDYNDRRGYRQHLKYTHYMVLKPMPKYRSLQSTIAPDPDDPNLYCRACDYTYASKKIYSEHCRCTHGIRSVKIRTRRAKPDGIIDTYCKPCDMRLSSKQSYKNHLFCIHKVDWRLNQQKSKDITPDINDPNFYCCACEKKLSNKSSFTIHLMTVHAIYLSAPKKTSLEPDINDPNNNCCACQKSYSCRNDYRRHLRYVHLLALPPLRGNVNLKSFPNPNNPHLYCSVCKRSFMTRKLYRSHCKKVHYMVLDHFSITNPNAMIDINHPDLYCAQCDHSYSEQSYFRRHLRTVHNI
ncbi:hypothetical protein HMPREF1544_09413 [Mucor circinelloides 1006PhL]|uniref:C2H2-type domain-containing protein n=1 Tax=Mucor circinelloides f. circinelloides (strain 1006PhL) TaxID=1220926 RepID=S2J2H7_MUCC1|nr:hypothetical protein HMPREF1544_09413 [Mucor circinelloides 1006PhL]